MERNTSTCYCFIAIALMLSTSSIVMSIILLTRPYTMVRESTQINSRENVKVADCPPPAPVQQSEVTQAKKPYVFAYDVPWNEYQYITDDGHLRGLSVEIIDAVCKEAGQACRHIPIPIKYCWNSDESIGTGLLSNWFDACAVFLKTRARDNIFRFSGTFYKPKLAQFYVLSTSSVNLTNANIGVKSSWYIGRECVQAMGEKVGSVLQTESTDDLKGLLMNRTVDAVLVEEGVFDGERGIKSSSEVYDCSLGGSGVMHRADSDISSWFSSALDVIKRQGTFQKLCDGYESLKDTCTMRND